MMQILLLLLLSVVCLVQRTTCFCHHYRTLTTKRHWQNNNLQTSHQYFAHRFTTATALSLSSQETTDQWKYHTSYVSNDDDEIIHGRHNAVITNTADLNNRWIGSFFDPSSQTIHTNNSSSSSSSSPPIEALQAIQATHRWADKFVRQLNLCPWAGSSLDKPGAIGYWAILIEEEDDDEGMILDKMEEIVREAGVQLSLATTSKYEDVGQIIDPSVAISFIILVPMGRTSNNKSSLPNFGNHHEFFIDLEDRLLDECDDYCETSDDNDDDDEDETEDNNDLNVNSLGCEITIAAFHPDWQFNGSEGADGDAINYEKRTPYPTISIVMSSVIESLMKEREDGNGDSSSSALATERIADSNEKTLCAIGVERLKEIFDEEVLRCPMNGKGEE